MPEERRIRIAAFCGSLREGSYTNIALRVALTAAEGPLSETDFIDLRAFNLPFSDGRKTPSK
jgi:NAD(P)H-dependent FMN reductase